MHTFRFSNSGSEILAYVHTKLLGADLSSPVSSTVCARDPLGWGPHLDVRLRQPSTSHAGLHTDAPGREFALKVPAWTHLGQNIHSEVTGFQLKSCLASESQEQLVVVNTGVYIMNHRGLSFCNTATLAANIMLHDAISI